MVSIIVAVAYPIVLSADILNEYMLLCICDINLVALVRHRFVAFVSSRISPRDQAH